MRKSIVGVKKNETLKIVLEPVTRMDLIKYSGASGDFNPIHNIMGIGPVPATKKVMEKSGLSLDDMDIIELNEAFASQVIACDRELSFDPEKLNVNGGSIAHGHPLGATGAILITKAVYELKRRSGRYALITACIGGGQGIALIIEREESWNRRWKYANKTS